MKPFFVTGTGSLPKTPELLRARKKFHAGLISQTDLCLAEDKATAFWMEFQNAIGVDGPVPSEMDRDDMIAYFTRKLHGFVEGELHESFKRFCYHKPRCVGPIKTKVLPGFTVRSWMYAQSLSRAPVVGILTDPFTIAAWSDNEHYLEVDDRGFFREKRRDMVEPLVAFITDEACVLTHVMTHIAGISNPEIQLDFPGVTTWPEDIELGIWAMNEVIAEVRRHYPCVNFRTHICFPPPLDSYARIYPKILELRVDTFLLDLEAEISQSGRLTMQDKTFLDLVRDNPFPRTLVIGWQYVHHDILPDERRLIAFIEKLLTAGMKPEQLGISPSCGLKTRSVEVAQNFMRQNAEVSEKLRTLFL